MPSSVIEQAYLEKPATVTGCDFSHLTLRESGAGYAVEEVIGTVAPDGKRRGEIVPLVSAVALDVARLTFEQHLAERKTSGYCPTRPTNR